MSLAASGVGVYILPSGWRDANERRHPSQRRCLVASQSELWRGVVRAPSSLTSAATEGREGPFAPPPPPSPLASRFWFG